MKRDYWLFPKSNLVVEKYLGVVNKEHFERHKGVLFNEVKSENNELTALVDISQANFFNIKYDELKAVYEGLLSRLGHGVSAKIAVLNGDNAKDDYLKVSQFTKFENDNVQLQSFVELNDALSWLSPHPDDRTKIISHLK